MEISTLSTPPAVSPAALDIEITARIAANVAATVARRAAKQATRDRLAARRTHGLAARHAAKPHQPEQKRTNP